MNSTPLEQVTVGPDTKSLGPTGLAAFRYPATLAIGDLVLQMLAVSDNAAADVLLDRVGIDRVNDSLQRWGCPGIRVRHRLQRMYECAAGAAGGDFALALDLAIQSGETGRHAIETLDPAYGNIASARSLVDLLERVWLDRIAEPATTAELRRLMAMQVFTHRLSSDLRADDLAAAAARRPGRSCTCDTRSGSSSRSPRWVLRGARRAHPVDPPRDDRSRHRHGNRCRRAQRVRGVTPVTAA